MGNGDKAFEELFDFDKDNSAWLSEHDEPVDSLLVLEFLFGDTVPFANDSDASVLPFDRALELGLKISWISVSVKSFSAVFLFAMFSMYLGELTKTMSASSLSCGVGPCGEALLDLNDEIGEEIRLSFGFARAKKTKKTKLICTSASKMPWN